MKQEKTAARILALALAAVMAFGPSAAAKGSDHIGTEAQAARFSPGDLKRVEAFANEFFASDSFRSSGAPGAVVAIVKDNQVLLNKGYGMANAETRIPMTADTVVRIASISKSVTATAVMQLVDQGRIGLDDNIEAYLGEGLKLSNPFKEPVTIKHLLTHTTGFDYTDMDMKDIHTDFGQYTSMEQYLQERMPSVVRKPGDMFKYDNFANLLQGYIVEQVSEMPFEQYMENHIFKPLGMTHSGFVMDADTRSSMAVGYDSSGAAIAPYAYTPTIAPHGSMHSTSSDMTRFMMAHLNSGELDGHRILSGSAAEEMHRFHYAIHPKKPNMTYGFEAALHPLHNGRHVIEKAGDTDGFSSWMWLLPEEKVGIFIAYNTKNSHLRVEFMQAFMNRFFPEESAKPVFLKPSRTELERFAGLYRDARKGMNLTRIAASDDGKLLVEDTVGGKVELRQIDPLLFIDDYGLTMAFKEREDGAIGYMMYLNPYSMAIKAPDQPPGTGTGVPAAQPYRDAIEQLQKLGVMEGQEDYPLRAEEAVTRGEFARLLTGMLDLPLSRSSAAFTDTADSPYLRHINTLAERGLIKGTAGGAFEPDRLISRQEAAAILWRTLVQAAPAKPSEAALAGAADSWALEAVQSIAARQLFGPDTAPGADGRIEVRATEPMLRQEAAYMLYHAFQGLYREGGLF
ncbi:serine hydrolase [Paenibacillus thiaminolyticus]|uniref:beta-lactamase family protein n=1 Tax=Paenibacillus thiaminolyticus TaxID=49283 RepID=UPI00232F8A62|nr:beta-lactamase family protein [Paenibacillus thiaminolyticus]WCF10790.1 serine hydrolase [Paenibacillus thiaminolyticus]